MPRSRPGPSKSMFASLPWDLKKTLRAQKYEFVDPQIQTGSGSGSSDLIGGRLPDIGRDGLLGTQPTSENEDEDISAGPSNTASVIVPSVNINVCSTTSTPSKRPLSALLTPASQSSAKKKGKRRADINVEDEDGVVNEYAGHAWDCTGLVERYTKYEQVPSDLIKYFGQRLLLFSEYDTLPLLLDRTGWYSVTPQSIASHIAERCACDLIIDAFCGVGGNAIEFARTCERVIAIDNDPIRLRLARHNALQCGVAHRIEFILGDYVEFAKSYAARNSNDTIDVVFLSPPWGGIDYLSTESPTYPLSAILPLSGSDLFEITSSLTPNIAYYLPRNVDMKEVGALARNLEMQAGRIETESLGEGRKKEWVEVEEEWVGDKLKAVTAYYGGLVAE